MGFEGLKGKASNMNKDEVVRTFLEERWRKDMRDSFSTVNPLRNSTADPRRWSWWEWIKVNVLGLVLVPIRVFLLLFFVALSWFLTTLILGRCKVEDLQRHPAPRLRRALLSRLLGAISRMMLFVAGFYWISSEGNADLSAPIVISNHPSLWESLWLVWAYRTPMAVSKAENRKLPFFGWLFDALQFLCVDRSSAESRRMVANEIIRRTRSHSEGWPTLWLFPEGTNVAANTAFINFKRGAFAPAVPIQPVLFRLPFVHQDPSLVGLATFGRTMWRTLSQLVNHMHVEYMPMHTPSKEEMESPDLYATRLRRSMAETLNVPLTEHSFDDVYLQTRGLKISTSYPVDELVVEFDRLQRLLGKGSESRDSLIDFELPLSRSWLGAMVPSFIELDKKFRGYILRSEFVLAFGLREDADVVVSLLTLLDPDNTQRISFRNFSVTITYLRCLLLHLARSFRAEMNSIPDSIFCNRSVFASRWDKLEISLLASDDDLVEKLPPLLWPCLFLSRFSTPNRINSK